MGTELIEIPTSVDVEPEIRDLVEQVKALTITNPETRAVALDLMDRARTLKKETEAKKKDETAPLREALDRICEPFDFVIKLMKIVDEACVNRLRKYDAAVEDQRRKEQAELNRRIAEENAKRIQEAEQANDFPVLAAPAIVESAPKTVVTESGGTVTKAKRKTWKIRNVDPTEDVEDIPASDPRLKNIPPQYLVICKKRITAAVNAGLPVCDDIEVFDVFDYRQSKAKK